MIYEWNDMTVYHYIYQLLIIRLYMERGQPGGGANLSPLSTNFCVYYSNQ